jgi:DNA primase
MVDQRLINLVDSVLGGGKSTSKNNRAYHCPFCHHPKPKLEINLDTNSKGENPWHCWVCNAKGKKLFRIFTHLSVNTEIISQLKILVGSSQSEYIDNLNKIIELPKEFTPLFNVTKHNLTGRRALAYLKKRNVTSFDILKYNIGYCENGSYANMIVIPSYDNMGNLNYFTARGFEEFSQSKYKNPDVSRNIIPFELFINWNLPIILCEGVFDALAIKRNVIPLLGKNIQDNLRKKLVTSQVKKIYIALDKDAIKQALIFCEELLNEGKEVYLVDLQEKDPGEMGFEKFTTLIQHTPQLTFSKLFEKKIQLL